MPGPEGSRESASQEFKLAAGTWRSGYGRTGTMVLRRHPSGAPSVSGFTEQQLGPCTRPGGHVREEGPLLHQAMLPAITPQDLCLVAEFNGNAFHVSQFSGMFSSG